MEYNGYVFTTISKLNLLLYVNPTKTLQLTSVIIYQTFYKMKKIN